MHREEQIALLTARKKQMVVGMLDHLCQQIEITETQFKTAKSRYEAVGTWLSGSNSPNLENVQIYPQGSIALGTTIKPMASNEFDVDLMCHLPNFQHTADARMIKTLIGDRLKENAMYSGMLEEKKRCWRINYANEFHLDITPSIGNPYCHQGGELVPDKAFAQWKPTNPKGYIQKFDQYASIKPRLYVADVRLTEARADVSPLPEQAMTKPFLKRIVQLLKRHRDQQFVGTKRENLAPISVIITTLAGWAYAKCAVQQLHVDAFDFISAVIREMPSFIRTEMQSDGRHYIIENETTVGENFADKWNSDPNLAAAFYDWHRDVLSSIETLLRIEGVDQYSESLSENFGAKKDGLKDAFSKFITPIGQARSHGLLSIVPSLGLIASPTFGSVIVPKNTFFGR